MNKIVVACATLASPGAPLHAPHASETAYASPADGRFLGRKALVASTGKTF